MAKSETYKEPPQELLERYFREIREGRSRKSVVNALRKRGYTISETVLRHRYEVWLAYQQAKEEFEKRLNQIKGELKKEFEEKLRERIRKFRYELSDLYGKDLLTMDFTLYQVLGRETYDEFKRQYEEDDYDPFEDPVGILNELKEKINENEERIRLTRSELQYVIQELSQLRKQNYLLARLLSAIISGIYLKEKESGLFDRKDLWDFISEKVASNDLDELYKLAGNL